MTDFDLAAARGLIRTMMDADIAPREYPVVIPATLYRKARKIVRHDPDRLAEFEKRYVIDRPIPFTPRKGGFRHVWEFWKR